MTPSDDKATIKESQIADLHETLQSLFRQIIENPRTRVSELSGALDSATSVRPFSDWKPAAENDLTIQPLADDVDPDVESRLDDAVVASETDYDFEKLDRVFLTGATGFVGAYLIDALLKQCDAELYCLVRADNESHGRERLLANLEKYGLDAGERTKRLVHPWSAMQSGACLNT